MRSRSTARARSPWRRSCRLEEQPRVRPSWGFRPARRSPFQPVPTSITSGPGGLLVELELRRLPVPGRRVRRATTSTTRPTPSIDRRVRLHQRGRRRGGRPTGSAYAPELSRRRGRWPPRAATRLADVCWPTKIRPDGTRKLPLEQELVRLRTGARRSDPTAWRTWRTGSQLAGGGTAIRVDPDGRRRSRRRGRVRSAVDVPGLRLHRRRRQRRPRGDRSASCWVGKNH